MRYMAPTLLIPILLLMALPAAAEVIGHPDLSGEWVLNEKASDDPAMVMLRARGSGGGMGRGDGIGGSGHGGGGGRGGGSGARPEGGSGNPGARLMERFQTLTVFHDAGEIDITDGLDISRFLHIDGKAEKVWTERGQVMATARWAGNILEVLWQGHGVDRTSYYDLSADGSRLVVIEQVLPPNSGETIKLRLVYDRAAVPPGTASK